MGEADHKLDEYQFSKWKEKCLSKGKKNILLINRTY